MKLFPSTNATRSPSGVQKPSLSGRPVKRSDYLERMQQISMKGKYGPLSCKFNVCNLCSYFASHSKLHTIVTRTLSPAAEERLVMVNVSSFSDSLALSTNSLCRNHSAGTTSAGLRRHSSISKLLSSQVVALERGQDDRPSLADIMDYEITIDDLQPTASGLLEDQTDADEVEHIRRLRGDTPLGTAGPGVAFSRNHTPSAQPDPSFIHAENSHARTRSDGKRASTPPRGTPTGPTHRSMRPRPPQSPLTMPSTMQVTDATSIADQQHGVKPLRPPWRTARRLSHDNPVTGMPVAHHPVPPGRQRHHTTTGRPTQPSTAHADSTTWPIMSASGSPRHARLVAKPPTAGTGGVRGSIAPTNRHSTPTNPAHRVRRRRSSAASHAASPDGPGIAPPPPTATASASTHSPSGGGRYTPIPWSRDIWASHGGSGDSSDASDSVDTGDPSGSHDPRNIRYARPSTPLGRHPGSTGVSSPAVRLSSARSRSPLSETRQSVSPLQSSPGGGTASRLRERAFQTLSGDASVHPMLLQANTKSRMSGILVVDVQPSPPHTSPDSPVDSPRTVGSDEGGKSAGSAWHSGEPYFAHHPPQRGVHQRFQTPIQVPDVAGLLHAAEAGEVQLGHDSTTSATATTAHVPAGFAGEEDVIMRALGFGLK